VKSVDEVLTRQRFGAIRIWKVREMTRAKLPRKDTMTTTTNTTAVTRAQITIAKSDLPKELRRSDYAIRVIDYGHEPGVLSGAELKGNAKKWSGKYAAKRAEVVKAMAAFGVYSEQIICPKRRVGIRVWTDGEGRQVEVTVTA
jgi:hypothetical protein